LVKSLREFAFSEIRGLIQTDVDVFNPEDTVSKVLGELERHGHYEALVQSNGKVGLVTIRDLLDVVQPEQTTIGDHPNDRWRAYRLVTPVHSVLDVVEIMIEDKVRALPVVLEGKALGYICQVDILEALCDIPEISEFLSKDLMISPVVSMDIDDNIGKAKRLMLDKRFSHIPIVKNNKLVGIVTAKALVHTFVTPIGTSTTGERFGEKIPRLTGTVGEIMEKLPLTAGPDVNALQIAEMMNERKKTACLIMLEDNRVFGILTPRELMAPMLRFRGEDELPVYIVGLQEYGDFYEKAIVEEKVRRVVKRAMKIHPHLSEISIRISATRERGNRSRYEVTANVYSKATEEQFDIGKSGWDLMKVFDEISDTLDRLLRDSKHEAKILSERERRARYSLWLRT